MKLATAAHAAGLLRAAAVMCLLAAIAPSTGLRTSSAVTTPTAAAVHASFATYRTFPPQSPNPAIGNHFSAVRRAYSGERAREIVAFVEQFWRVPGNTGFDASIERVATELAAAGYVDEADATDGTRLTYRVERRPLQGPTWDPVDASLEIAGGERLLSFDANRNMLARNSFSTPVEGIEAEIVYVGDGSPERYEGLDVQGKIVFGDTSVGRLFRDAVQGRGAAGVLSYSMPAYTQPERNRDSIQFSRIPLDPDTRGWGLRLSYRARRRLLDALTIGTVRARVRVETRIYESEELTLVADVRGSDHPDERFVFSAHVQEPGANDNASGVGALAEVARVIARLVRDGSFRPRRTITMLWGDEISSTRRYLEDDPRRTAGVLWGMSLDMVGEDTSKTGGTFLIEKMPDPSAVWTRGEDRHTEWGGRPLSIDDMTPHYFNDFVLNRCREQAAATGWVVSTNPYEGGSDHVPFLRAGKPGLLLWHFTDQYYHTDGDRIEMVSAQTLKNVGTCALVSAMTLTSADGDTARFVVGELERAALSRLEAEFALSRDAVRTGADVDEQILIVESWTDWYRGAILSARDIEVGGSSPETAAAVDSAAARVTAAAEGLLERLKGR